MGTELQQAVLFGSLHSLIITANDKELSPRYRSRDNNRNKKLY